MPDIEDLRARLAHEEAALADAQRQIDAAHRRIEKLRELSASLEKRVALLRQYIDVVESGGDTEDLIGDVPAPAKESPRSGGGSPGGTTGLEIFGELGTPTPPPTGAALPDDAIDDHRLSHELLPRTHSFEDALLILLAHRKKSLRARDIARDFRKLEYTPNVKATKDAIENHLDSRPAFFERVTGGGFTLTAEGKQEAQRLLDQITE